MTLASHARGPEFEPRCEYSIFFLPRQKISQRRRIQQTSSIHTNQTRTPNITPHPNVHSTRYLIFFFLKEALDMLRTFIWFDHGEWKPKEWECRIQVFSKLVESAQNTPWDPFVTQSTPKTLSNPHFGPKQEPPMNKIGQSDHQQKTTFAADAIPLFFF